MGITQVEDEKRRNPEGVWQGEHDLRNSDFRLAFDTP
eukprot:CAMPEP_0115019282 /NCGR_PEP_ID=MMETSP0216-20121206/29345_1 /TAXON_ID=223996 /ORGANISM="Protocruzia adherens, Strain Boccale" /LENGTH=36 /DNA_ID= /DNA_START= /DNA_END= /DNA_ORIENTATION=